MTLLTALSDLQLSMSNRAASRKLTRRLIIGERALCVKLSAGLAICVAAVVLFDGVRASGSRAQFHSAFAINAGHQYSLEVASPEDAILLDGAGFTRVSTSPTTVTSDTGTLDVALVASNTPTVVRNYGVVLSESAEPAASGGVAVSEAVAKTLRLGVGDSIRISEPVVIIGQSHVVTRIFVIPNDPGFSAVAATVPGPAVGSPRWLLDDRDLAEPLVGDLIKEGYPSVRLRSSEGAAVEQADLLDAGRFAPLKYAGPFGLLFSLATWTAVTALARNRILRHRAAFEALGLTESEARSVLRRAVSACAAAGAAAGGIAGVAATLLTYGALGRLVDQAWQTGAINPALRS